MIVTRLVSLILRAAQFVFAVIVLGLTAYFLHQRLSHGVGPLGRVIYTVIWSSLSIIFSVIWMIPTKSTIASYGSDLRTFLTPPSPTLVTRQQDINTPHQSSQPAGPPPSACWCATSTRRAAAARGRGRASVCAAATRAGSGRPRRRSRSCRSSSGLRLLCLV
jgi:hypothetical protein